MAKAFLIKIDVYVLQTTADAGCLMILIRREE
jgi:hypothetical protein